MSDNSEVLDLDALVPPSVTIKFGGQEIEVKPPKTNEVFRLGFLGQKLSNAQDLNDAELEKIVTDINSLIAKCIPELTGKDLNTTQLLRLVQIISDMATPPDVTQLKDKGVTPTDPKVPQE